MIKGKLFIDLFVLGLVLLGINHFFEIKKEVVKIICMVLITAYGLLRIILFLNWWGGEYKDSILPEFGKGFMPDYDLMKRGWEDHYMKVYEFLQFMPIFFVAFVINHIIIKPYKRVREWANDRLTIKFKENGN